MSPIFLKNGRDPILLHNKVPLLSLACQALSNWPVSSLQLYPLPHNPHSIVFCPPCATGPDIPVLLNCLPLSPGPILSNNQSHSSKVTSHPWQVTSLRCFIHTSFSMHFTALSLSTLLFNPLPQLSHELLQSKERPINGAPGQCRFIKKWQSLYQLLKCEWSEDVEEAGQAHCVIAVKLVCPSRGQDRNSRWLRLRSLQVPHRRGIGRGLRTCPRVALLPIWTYFSPATFRTLSTGTHSLVLSFPNPGIKGERRDRVHKHSHGPLPPFPLKKQRRRREYVQLSAGQSTSGNRNVPHIFCLKKPVSHRSDYNRLS